MQEHGLVGEITMSTEFMSSIQAWEDDSEHFFATRSEISPGDLDTTANDIMAFHSLLKLSVIFTLPVL